MRFSFLPCFDEWNRNRLYAFTYSTRASNSLLIPDRERPYFTSFTLDPPNLRFPLDRINPSVLQEVL